MTGKVDFDLTDFDFKGGTVVFSFGKNGEPRNMMNVEMRENAIQTVAFPAEFCANLTVGKGNYEYDLAWHVDGNRFPICAPSSVTVQRTIGGVDRG